MGRTGIRKLDRENGRPRGARGPSVDRLSLFVYGTLMRGECAHFRVAPAVRSVEAAWTTGHLVRLPEGYPALIPGLNRRVHGELLELDRDATFDEVDAYEGFDPDHPEASLFVREMRGVTCATGRPLRAWCYVMRAYPGVADGPADLRVVDAVPIADGRWPRNVEPDGP